MAGFRGFLGLRNMLGLQLREEFRGKRLKGTAIELSSDTNTGATQFAAEALLEISELAALGRLLEIRISDRTICACALGRLRWPQRKNCSHKKLLKPYCCYREHGNAGVAIAVDGRGINRQW